jgi:hypothetical protein
VTIDALIIKFFRITLQEKRRYAVPWLLCETASFLVQVAGFAYYVTQKKTNELNIGVLVAAIVNIGNKKHRYYEYTSRSNRQKIRGYKATHSSVSAVPENLVGNYFFYYLFGIVITLP